MTTLYVVTAVILLLYLSILEGSVLAMKDKLALGDMPRAKKWDQFRHTWTTILRFAVFPISFIYLWPLQWSKLWLVFVFVFLAWTGWNTILNLSRSLPWYYKGSVSTGTSSMIDKALSNIYIYWIIQGLVPIAAILCLIFLNR